MTTTLQELDEVLKSIADDNDFASAMERFLDDHAPEIRAALELQAKYKELLFAVGNKYPDESRHETALRYIKQAEETQPASDAAPPAQRDEKGRQMTYWGGMSTPAQGEQS